jgi:NAD(P)H dehydrogenase (quinone)
MAIVAVVYHSGFGHTKIQAEAVHRGAGSVAGVESRLVVNAMQHGMIYVGTGVLPAVSHPETMGSVQGPGPEVQNRVGSFVGPMSASFQVQVPDAPAPGDLATAENYGVRVAQITLRLKG